MTIIDPASPTGFAEPTDEAIAPVAAPAAALRPARDRSPFDLLLGPLAVFTLFIGAWYLLHALMTDDRKFLVPMPHTVLTEAFFKWDRLQPLLEALWLSTRVALTGLVIAIVVGVSLAILMSQASWIERSLYPYMVALQAIPILAFVPLIGALFEFNFRSRVIVCVIIALFPIVANTLFGLLSVDRSHHELFTLLHVGRWTRLRKLQLPAAMPSIFNGFRISAGLAVIGAVVGDFFFRQGQAGIGQLIDVYRARLRNPEMYAAVILAAALGIVVFWLFGLLSRKVVGHWYETTRQRG